MNFVKRNWIPFFAIAVILTGVYFLASAGNQLRSQEDSRVAKQAVVAAPVSVTQPPSASDVARSLNCKRFEDHGASQIGGSIDSGACWIGNVKYAINTFPSKAVRDSWLQAAEPLGVVPKWKTTTSVTYKSVD